MNVSARQMEQVRNWMRSKMRAGTWYSTSIQTSPGGSVTARVTDIPAGETVEKIFLPSFRDDSSLAQVVDTVRKGLEEGRVHTREEPSAVQVEMENYTGARGGTRDPRVLLWYKHMGNNRVELHSDMDSAVEEAISMQEEGSGLPVGIQYADGRAEMIKDVDAYRKRREELDTFFDDDPTTMRQHQIAIDSPFDGGTAFMVVDRRGEPDWPWLAERRRR